MTTVLIVLYQTSVADRTGRVTMETAMDRYTVEERLDDFHDILRSDCRFGIADGWSSQLQLDPTV